MKKLKLLLLGLLIPLSAFAWKPDRQIEVIMAWTPGSVNELTFRVLAKEVTQNTGAQFNIVNRPGAGGVIGTEELSKKPANGYYTTMASIPGLAAMDAVSVPTKSYNVDSFEYPFFAATSPFAVVANAKDPVDNTGKFVSTVKSTPVSIAASGGARLAYEDMIERLGLKEDATGIVRVDHKGPTDALTDVAGGNVRFAIVPVSIAYEFSKGDKVKIVAIIGSQKLARLLGVGYIDSNITGAWGLLLPKGTPDDVIAWYNKEFNRALESQEVHKIYKNNLLLENILLSTPAAYAEFVKKRDKEWKPLVNTVLSKTNK